MSLFLFVCLFVCLFVLYGCALSSSVCLMTCAIDLTVAPFRNQMYELRGIEHQRLVSEDKDNKKANLEANIRSKR